MSQKKLDGKELEETSNASLEEQKPLDMDKDLFMSKRVIEKWFGKEKCLTTEEVTQNSLLDHNIIIVDSSSKPFTTVNDKHGEQTVFNVKVIVLDYDSDVEAYLKALREKRKEVLNKCVIVTLWGNLAKTYVEGYPTKPIEPILTRVEEVVTGNQRTCYVFTAAKFAN